MIIQCDNLEVLIALKENYKKKFKCIYIDPPYNTGKEFKHYKDKLDEIEWLRLLKPRLKEMRELLREDGVIFISINDNSYAYLKIMADEIFGRQNYCGTFVWEKKKKPSFLSKIGIVTEYIISYSSYKKTAPIFTYGKTTKNKRIPINNAGNGISKLNFKPKSVIFSLNDQIIHPQDMSNGNIHTKLLNKVIIKNGVNNNAFVLEGEWRYSQKSIDNLINNNETIQIKKIPFRPNYISSLAYPKKISNLLDIRKFNISTYENGQNESKKIFGTKKKFDYQKPEKLIQILLESVTSPNDLILDAYAGTGTTGAVAHMIGRKWIMIESGPHCKSHIVKRLKNVIDGKNNYGISKSVNWRGGGRFKFYKTSIK